MDHLIVYTDGSRIPMKDNTSTCGIGIWFGDQDNRNESIRIQSRDCTNQLAELLAIRKALAYTREISNLTIRSDSKYSINSITIWHKKWLINDWKNFKGHEIANKSVIIQILSIIQSREQRNFQTVFEHVKAHNGNIGNEGADKLAKQGSLTNIKF